MNSRQLVLKKLFAAVLSVAMLGLAGCGGGGSAPAATATLSQSTIQLPTQVQVVSPK
jgi:ABC-type glycerol-3-phosphate transport system substrate-binding protein